MASQEEDNRLECVSDVNKEQETYIINVYKKNEHILNNKNELFENKIKSMIDVWRSIGELNLSQFDPRHVVQIMDWAKLHALDIVLTAEWNAYKASCQDRLLEEVEKAQNGLLKLNSGFATRCKKLADVVRNPWEDPVLMKLMKTRDSDIGYQEIEFFCMETAYLVSVRLKKLCESQCEDLALNLAAAFIKCNKLAKIQSFNLNASETHMWFIFDIYIALLYKFQEKQKIVASLKELTFEEGLQLIKRFAKKRIKIAKIWKNCQRVAILALQMYISRVVLRLTSDLTDVLNDYVSIYLSLCHTEELLQDYANAIRRISNLADASGLYIFSFVTQLKAGVRLKPFIIEMYIRGLTTDMNDLERRKDSNETQIVSHITTRLAKAFCNLGEFLNDHVKVARECILTAFSLEPTVERLRMIEHLARRSGFHVLDTGQEWKCKSHPPALPTDEVMWQCPDCGDWMCKPQLTLTKINMALNEALQNSVLGISQALCDDLVVCLSNPRYQILSWFLPWEDLHRICIMYLRDPQATKNFITELKFIDIDYTRFKDIKPEPIDNLNGIERGYEHYLDISIVSGEESTDTSSEDSVLQYSPTFNLGIEEAGESINSISPLPMQQKSNPDILKSLRMFRPNLKRREKIESDHITAKKVSKKDLSCSINSDPSTSSVSRNLSDYLNSVPSPNISNTEIGGSQALESKNVQGATLPQLYGQVAENKLKSVQVHLQPLSLDLLKTLSQKQPEVQVVKFGNLEDNTIIADMKKKELKVELLNKPLQNGYKANSSYISSRIVQDIPPVLNPRGPLVIKSPSRINQEHVSPKAAKISLKELIIPIQDILAGQEKQVISFTPTLNHEHQQEIQEKVNPIEGRYLESKVEELPSILPDIKETNQITMTSLIPETIQFLNRERPPTPTASLNLPLEDHVSDTVILNHERQQEIQEQVNSTEYLERDVEELSSSILSEIKETNQITMTSLIPETIQYLNRERPLTPTGSLNLPLEDHMSDTVILNHERQQDIQEQVNSTEYVEREVEELPSSILAEIKETNQITMTSLIPETIQYLNRERPPTPTESLNLPLEDHVSDTVILNHERQQEIQEQVNSTEYLERQVKELPSSILSEIKETNQITMTSLIPETIQYLNREKPPKPTESLNLPLEDHVSDTVILSHERQQEIQEQVNSTKYLEREVEELPLSISSKIKETNQITVTSLTPEMIECLNREECLLKPTEPLILPPEDQVSDTPTLSHEHQDIQEKIDCIEYRSLERKIEELPSSILLERKETNQITVTSLTPETIECLNKEESQSKPTEPLTLSPKDHLSDTPTLNHEPHDIQEKIDCIEYRSVKRKIEELPSSNLLDRKETNQITVTSLTPETIKCLNGESLPKPTEPLTLPPEDHVSNTLTLNHKRQQDIQEKIDSTEYHCLEKEVEEVSSSILPKRKDTNQITLTSLVPEMIKYLRKEWLLKPTKPLTLLPKDHVSDTLNREGQQEMQKKKYSTKCRRCLEKEVEELLSCIFPERKDTKQIAMTYLIPEMIKYLQRERSLTLPHENHAASDTRTWKKRKHQQEIEEEISFAKCRYCLEREVEEFSSFSSSQITMTSLISKMIQFLKGKMPPKPPEPLTSLSENHVSDTLHEINAVNCLDVSIVDLPDQMKNVSISSHKIKIDTQIHPQPQFSNSVPTQKIKGLPKSCRLPQVNVPTYPIEVNNVAIGEQKMDANVQAQSTFSEQKQSQESIVLQPLRSTVTHPLIIQPIQEAMKLQERTQMQHIHLTTSQADVKRLPFSEQKMMANIQLRDILPEQNLSQKLLVLQALKQTDAHQEVIQPIQEIKKSQELCNTTIIQTQQVHLTTSQVDLKHLPISEQEGKANTQAQNISPEQNHSQNPTVVRPLTPTVACHEAVQPIQETVKSHSNLITIATQTEDIYFSTVQSDVPEPQHILPEQDQSRNSSVLQQLKPAVAYQEIVQPIRETIQLMEKNTPDPLPEILASPEVMQPTRETKKLQENFKTTAPRVAVIDLTSSPDKMKNQPTMNPKAILASLPPTVRQILFPELCASQESCDTITTSTAQHNATTSQEKVLDLPAAAQTGGTVSPPSSFRPVWAEPSPFKKCRLSEPLKTTPYPKASTPMRKTQKLRNFCDTTQSFCNTAPSMFDKTQKFYKTTPSFCKKTPSVFEKGLSLLDSTSTSSFCNTTSSIRSKTPNMFNRAPSKLNSTKTPNFCKKTPNMFDRARSKLNSTSTPSFYNTTPVFQINLTSSDEDSDSQMPWCSFMKKATNQSFGKQKKKTCRRRRHASQKKDMVSSHIPVIDLVDSDQEDVAVTLGQPSVHQAMSSHTNTSQVKIMTAQSENTQTQILPTKLSHVIGPNICNSLVKDPSSSTKKNYLPREIESSSEIPRVMSHHLSNKDFHQENAEIPREVSPHHLSNKDSQHEKAEISREVSPHHSSNKDSQQEKAEISREVSPHHSVNKDSQQENTEISREMPLHHSSNRDPQQERAEIPSVVSPNRSSNKDSQQEKADIPREVLPHNSSNRDPRQETAEIASVVSPQHSSSKDSQQEKAEIPRVVLHHPLNKGFQQEKTEIPRVVSPHHLMNLEVDPLFKENRPKEINIHMPLLTSMNEINQESKINQLENQNLVQAFSPFSRLRQKKDIIPVYPKPCQEESTPNVVSLEAQYLKKVNKDSSRNQTVCNSGANQVMEVDQSVSTTTCHSQSMMKEACLVEVHQQTLTSTLRSQLMANNVQSVSSQTQVKIEDNLIPDKIELIPQANQMSLPNISVSQSVINNLPCAHLQPQMKIDKYGENHQQSREKQNLPDYCHLSHLQNNFDSTALDINDETRPTEMEQEKIEKCKLRQQNLTPPKMPRYDFTTRLAPDHYNVKSRGVVARSKVKVKFEAPQIIRTNSETPHVKFKVVHAIDSYSVMTNRINSSKTMKWFVTCKPPRLQIPKYFDKWWRIDKIIETQDAVIRECDNNEVSEEQDFEEQFPERSLSPEIPISLFCDDTLESDHQFDVCKVGEFSLNNEIEANEGLSSNPNLTPNIRTYSRKRTQLPNLNKDCMVDSFNETVFKTKKHVNSDVNVKSKRRKRRHSKLRKRRAGRRVLKVILHRLSLSELLRCGKSYQDNSNAMAKCDYSQESIRKRKRIDKSENKNEKSSNVTQAHRISPLQHINPRVNGKKVFKSCCDLKTSSKKDSKDDDSDRRPPMDRRYVQSVLANVPGLNDLEMLRPSDVNHIVNVVQVSVSRTTQNIAIQNTSTQVTPHIQRIGQPRLGDQKHDPISTSPSSGVATVPTSTATNTKNHTSQPSTLINILSQQVIGSAGPAVTQSNPVRRQAPVINILSQQIIRPSQTSQKSSGNNVNTTSTTAEAASQINQVKPVVTSAVTTETSNVTTIKTTTAGVKSVSSVATGTGSTILQFICKSSLPKFQQAFGKTVYHNNKEVVNSSTPNIDSNNSHGEIKKTVTRAVPVNIQPLQGSVIYSRQVPVGQTISLIPPGGTARQVFRIATSNPEQISLVKDSAIHSRMSALLAAALQNRPKNTEDLQINCDETTKVTLTRPALVQNARIVKPVQLQLPTNVRSTPQTNLSSTTLEQLREFDMVYKQIKERGSSTTTEGNVGTSESQETSPQRISVTYVNQLPKYTQLSPVVVVTSYSSLQPAASPALSVTSQGSSSPCLTSTSNPALPKISTTKSSKGKTLKSTTTNNTAKSSPIPKPQQKPQEDEHTTQRIFDILAEYAEQLRNSPDLNNKPAPRRRSNPPTNPSQSSKRKKSSSAKKSGQTANAVEVDTDDITIGSEDSSGGGIIQLSVTDDEQSQAATTVTTSDSNENSNPSSTRPVILNENALGSQPRNVIIADSTVGEALKMPNTAVIVPGSYIMPVSMVKGGQQIAVVSGGSKILATVPARSGQNMLLFQSFTNQNRKGAISAVKYSTVQPISGISSQSLAGVSAQPPVILPSNSVATAVALGQPITLKKVEERDTNDIVLTISPPKEEQKTISSVTQLDGTSVRNDSIDIKVEDIKAQDIKVDESNVPSDNSNEKNFQTYQKSVITNSTGTSVIATCSNIKTDESNGAQSIINVNLASDSVKSESKPNTRIQSVLVTACTSNGPMFSHATHRYKKPEMGRANQTEQTNKEEFVHNGEKTNNNDSKTYRGNANYYTNKTKKACIESLKVDSDIQKQAVIERELRLQKSLSEECEDLGVDEPSTSDLFPEADLLFDSNHSPSFDQTSQDIIKRSQSNEIKEVKHLFSDDETSNSLRTDLFEYVEYHTVDSGLEYQAGQLINNGNVNSNESGSSGCEDNTLLPKCTAMSDVTLNSPISPEMYQESSLHKYKFKYSNKKKCERIKATDFTEIEPSSEDLTGNTEMTKVNCEDDNLKLLHLALNKNEDSVKEGDQCELHCGDGDQDSPSGRGARRSVRKLCSCCNGSQDSNISKKRPHSSRPQTPSLHKKAFLGKKR